MASTGVRYKARTPQAMRKSVPHATRKRLRNEHWMRRWIMGRSSFHFTAAIEHLGAEVRIPNRSGKLDPIGRARRAREGVLGHRTTVDAQGLERGILPAEGLTQGDRHFAQWMELLAGGLQIRHGWQVADRLGLLDQAQPWARLTKA